MKIITLLLILSANCRFQTLPVETTYIEDNNTILYVETPLNGTHIWEESGTTLDGAEYVLMDTQNSSNPEDWVIVNK